MTKLFAIGLLAAATISAPALAGAAPSDEPRVAAVRFGDLNLDTAEGQQVLQRRLETAARQVCGTEERITGSFLASTSSHSCYVRALENLDREVAARIDRQSQRG